MKSFRCRCGQAVYFDNLHCTNCAADLGFDPGSGTMIAFDTDALQERAILDGYQPCHHRHTKVKCNWLLRDGGEQRYCESCRRSVHIPNLSVPRNLERLRQLEHAKRHLLYTLRTHELPLDGNAVYPHDLRFSFLEDKRSNLNVDEAWVNTGHSHGLITINVVEADDAERESTRNAMQEPYRTLLGHFRHESGHYYFDRLPSRLLNADRFCELFGDPGVNYDEALQRHYKAGPPQDWRKSFVSAYASAHPLEDWAETWAHYLHMTDTLETAADFNLARSPDDMDDTLMFSAWVELSLALNALNRSMGLPDAYPFVLSARVKEKLGFVHGVVTGSGPAS